MACCEIFLDYRKLYFKQLGGFFAIKNTKRNWILADSGDGINGDRVGGQVNKMGCGRVALLPEVCMTSKENHR